ncbi:MAG: hypothetical protein MSA15_04420 [Clostridium sp.]|nr:hypothetical protein [Clostridium sp.]
MARERLIACVHYRAEGVCDLGKEGTFWHQCQFCKTYSSLRHGRPARVDTRKQREERIRRKEKFDY